MQRRLWLALLVTVLMLGGVVGLFLSHTSAQQPRLVHLAQGWNLVAWTGANQPASEALASLGDAVQAVYGYNGDTQDFTRYVLGRPEFSTLTDFETEHAYWVLAQRPTDWSVPSSAGPSCPAGTPCPGCGQWQSLAEQCSASYDQCVTDFSDCVAVLTVCLATQPTDPDIDEVCGLIDDLSWQYDLSVPILDQYDLDWLSLTFIVQDLEGWERWNCD